MVGLLANEVSCLEIGDSILAHAFFKWPKPKAKGIGKKPVETAETKEGEKCS